MSTIDSRVVEMKFDNAQFEAGVRSTLSSLSSLAKALRMDNVKGPNFNGAVRGMGELNNASRRFSLAHIGQGVDQIASKFSALGIIGVSALATIASQATNVGGRMARGLFGPITDGFNEYETNLNSVQTILSNTQAAGTNLGQVNAALQELNHYSDQTIYNFSEMARNIGTFTAAGVDLKTATGSIKGIANLAALSGSNSAQASTAMYQLSQAISAGKVSLMDWNSVVNAGMGGTVFQRALAQTAVSMGKLPASAVKLSGEMKNVKINGEAFRESISAENGESWLTSDVLTNTLQQFTGDLSDAQLKAQGFTDAQIKSIQATAKTAKSAATEVKTITQLFGALKESVGSGWAQTWQTIIGDFGQAKTLWTGVNNVISGFIQTSSNARNKILGDWAKLGGRTAMIESIKNVFQALGSVIKPISQAFRDIFPPMTGQRLFELTSRLKDFTAGLKIGATTSQNLRRTFAGVFAIFSIIGQVLSGAARMVGRFFSAIAGGTGGFLNFTGGIGDFLVSLDKMLKRTGAVNKFFDGLGTLLIKPLSGLKKIGGFIGDLFANFDMPNFSGITDVLSSVVKWAHKAASAIGEVMVNVGSWIVDAFSNLDFSKALAVVNTGLLGGLVLLLRKFFKGGGFSLNIGGGVFDAISEGFNQLTGALQTMQSNIKANIILKIAGALAILAGALLILSSIDSEDMAKALFGVASSFAILQGAMMALNSAIGIMGTLKLPALALSLIGIAGSLVLIAGAIKLMSGMSWEEIGKGLAGIGGSLVVIAGAMQIMPKGMVLQAAAIGLLAISLSALAGAVKLFSMMDWKTMGTGLAGVAGSLLVIAGAMTLMPKGMLLQAAGLVAVAAAMNLMALALNQMGGMSWEAIGKGLVTLGGALVVLAGGLTLMTGSLAGSASLIVAAGAIAILTPALLAFSLLSWEGIGKGMVVLGGALLLLSGGLYLMTGALPGAAALIVATAALNLLIPVMVALGALSWEAIAKGLVALAGAFTVLGVAGLLLAPLTPIILGLSVAIGIIGGGLALAGVGAMAFATAFGILVAGIGAGVGVIKSVLSSLTQAIGAALLGLAQGIVKAAQFLAANAGRFASSMATIIGAVLRAVSANIPRVASLFLQFINAALRVLVSAVPRIASAGLTIMARLMAAINAKIPGLVSLASTMMVRFLNSLAGQMPRITQAGANLIVAFLNGLSRQIPRIATAATNLIVAFMRAIGANMGRITAEGTRLARQFISGVARGIAGGAGSLAGAAASVGGHIASGMARGVSAGIGVVIGAARRMASSALSAAKAALGVKSPSREFIKVGKFVVEGFAKGIRDNKATIHQTYAEMRTMLAETRNAAKQDIKEQSDRLKKLSKARKKDTKAIKATRVALTQAKKEYRNSATALATMDKYLRDDRNRLGRLADAHDLVTKKLDAANKKLSDAKKTRDDYNASLREQLVGHIDVNKDTKFPDFIGDLQKKIIDTQQFATKIQKLRSLGLNDYFYKELLAKGPEALPFLDQILAKGKNGVDEMNTLGSALYKASKSVGDTASKNLYQAAVDSAAGLVKGLQSQQKNIEKQMDKIADYMVKAIKRKLGIRSPSREFAKIGTWSIEGLAKGLKDSGAAEKAAASTGSSAILAMQKSLTGLSSLVESDMDMNPTITPVLDLSGVRKTAGQIGSMLPAGALSVGAASASATSASAGLKANQVALARLGAGMTGGASVTFIQNNNSPKALSSATIYRQTSSQIAKAKGALTK